MPLKFLVNNAHLGLMPANKYGMLRILYGIKNSLMVNETRFEKVEKTYLSRRLTPKKFSNSRKKKKN